MTNKIFTISEAAEYLGVFRLTLRNWEKQGKIKPLRTLGGHRRYRKEELERIMGIMERGTVSSKKQAELNRAAAVREA